MGLDMFLIKDNGCDSLDSFEFDSELVYWRKANQIHNYFCMVGEPIATEVFYKLKREDLLELIKYIEAILSKEEPDRSKLAKVMLPTVGGFFFGSTVYDKYYYEDLIYTKKELLELLESDDSDTFLYYASW